MIWIVGFQAKEIIAIEKPHILLSAIFAIIVILQRGFLDSVVIIKLYKSEFNSSQKALDVRTLILECT